MRALGICLRNIATAIAIGLFSLACAGVASATTTSPFGCRASMGRVALRGATVLEPLVANQATSPCATHSDGLQSASLPSAGTTVVRAGPASAYTFSSDSEPTTTGPVAPGAAALVAVEGVTIRTPGGGSIVVAGPVYAQASYACVNGSLQSASSSSLNALEVNGSRVTLGRGRGETIPLGGGSYVAVNERVQGANSLTRRVLDVHLNGGGEIVVGEAAVTRTGSDPCAGTSGGTPPAVFPCPSGSTYDPATQVCEIVASGSRMIVVSRPFAGPTGGTVMAVSVARRRFSSGCLKGRGPRYAIIGTRRGDRINGTRRGERIIGLGGRDRIAGQGGNDCIDGGAGRDRIWAGNGNVRVWGGGGNDRIWAGNGNDYVSGGSGSDKLFLGAGNDRVFGGAGSDRIAVGRGNDYVSGGAGSDRISTGDGNDRIYGGSGRDRIFAGNGKDHVFGGAGSDRIFAGGTRMWINCGSGRDLAYATVFTSGYAARHGCEQLRSIRLRKL